MVDTYCSLIFKTKSLNSSWSTFNQGTAFESSLLLAPSLLHCVRPESEPVQSGAKSQLERRHLRGGLHRGLLWFPRARFWFAVTNGDSCFLDIPAVGRPQRGFLGGERPQGCQGCRSLGARKPGVPRWGRSLHQGGSPAAYLDPRLTQTSCSSTHTPCMTVGAWTLSFLGMLALHRLGPL